MTEVSGIMHSMSLSEPPRPETRIAHVSQSDNGLTPHADYESHTAYGRERRRAHLKEITYDISEFLARAADPDRIRLSFLSRPAGDGLVSIQPRLFYPLADSILIWEGPASTFFTVQDDEIREFEKKMVQFVEEKLGFRPRFGRWEK
jgi:hypothetical protein